MRIFQVFHTVKAPQIYAIPSHNTFCQQVLPNLNSLPRNASIGEFQLADPTLKSEGFFNLSNCVLVFNEGIFYSQMAGVLDLAGNIHSARLKGIREELFVLNVTALYNCIDQDSTVFRSPTPSGEALGIDCQMGIKVPAFFPDLIGDSQIFRIPQMMSSIFVLSRSTDPEEDFYTWYANSGMSELEFKEVWKKQQ